MTRITIALLIGLFAGICSPLAIHVSPCDDSKYLITLDVCEKMHPGISINTDSPVIQECSVALVPFVAYGYLEESLENKSPLTILSALERPPAV